MWNVDSSCVWSTQVSICSPFALSSLGRNPLLYPPTFINPTLLPTLVCGPGGAGACRPEDRGSAGCQKHLSVPFPLHCNPPGTALSQPAPAVCVCGCVHLEWMITEKQVCISAHVRSFSVRAWVFLSLPIPPPKHTMTCECELIALSTWWLQHRIVYPATSSVPTYKISNMA